MPSLINSTIFEIVKRSEKQNRQHLVASFVEVGALYTVLCTPDNQILYGRRGTGKTHIFNCILNEVEQKNDIGIYIDMRNIGSNGCLYNDTSITLQERASRLLRDTYSIIHDRILDFALEQDDVDLSHIDPALRDLCSAIHQIQVQGEIDVSAATTNNHGHEDHGGITLSATPNWQYGTTETTQISSQKSIRTKGYESLRIHIPAISVHIRQLQKLLKNKKLWIFIDEWSEIPIDLQPFLADLLRRTLFPMADVVVKIAAIDRRTNIRIDTGCSYIGIEIGAELSSLNLDEYMVFDNDSTKAKDFFANLFFNHLKDSLRERGLDILNKAAFIRKTFTQSNAFDELVRAAEGVPRDAINILMLAAMKADTNKVSIPNIREAAHSWYVRDKEGGVNLNPEANLLLRYIIDTVIGERKARAFLLSCDTNMPIIEYLYDARVIHLVKTNISAKDSPGERYNVYAIDYGAYIHLHNTANAVQGELLNDQAQYVEIPMIDYRSIRRSVLDVSRFRFEIHNH